MLYIGFHIKHNIPVRNSLHTYMEVNDVLPSQTTYYTFLYITLQKPKSYLMKEQPKEEVILKSFEEKFFVKRNLHRRCCHRP